MRKTRPLKNRFMSGFDRNPNTGCWEWIGKLNHSGYGLITRGRGDYRDQRAHRISYELFVGPIPEGQVVHHECGNRRCVNPQHLTLDNRVANIQRDGNGGKIFCKNGHEFTHETTYITARGYRNCRVCHMVYQQIRRKRVEDGNRSYKGIAEEVSAHFASTPRALSTNWTSQPWRPPTTKVPMTLEEQRERKRERDHERWLRRKGPEYRARARARKTHCSKGHEFTPETTFVNKRGRRMCLVCRPTIGCDLAST
jgi:HNH endonuclease